MGNGYCNDETNSLGCSYDGGDCCLGSDIELISEESARSMNPKAFLVLPWNFKDEIVKREKKYLDNGGLLMFPMPYPHVIDKNGERKL